MNNKIRLPILILASIVVFGCSLITTAVPPQTATQTPAPPTGTATVPAAAPAPLIADSAAAALDSSLEAIYRQVSASVVQITVVQKPASGSAGSAAGGRTVASGSGFLWDTQGDIVTNNHVVENADTIRVSFPDGVQAEAKVIGTDPGSDLAVIRIAVEPSLLKPVTIADSDTVKVGQMAIVIGYPFGLDSTMTSGIVSGLSRLLPVSTSDGSGLSYSIPDVIQTDAPINPGNSGGVLLDELGMVIGVPSANISTSGSSAGVGFAIPSNIVKMVVPVLISSGSYPHAYLGISGESINPDLASAMGLDTNTRGILIADVQSGGPADKAGLRGSSTKVTIQGIQTVVGGDIIIGADGNTISAFEDLIRYMFLNKKIGDTMQLTVLRGMQTLTVDVNFTALTGQ